MGMEGESGMLETKVREVCEIGERLGDIGGEW